MSIDHQIRINLVNKFLANYIAQNQPLEQCYPTFDDPKEAKLFKMCLESAIRKIYRCGNNGSDFNYIGSEFKG